MYDISVIIPSHNRSGLLRKTLSLLNEQTYPHNKFEVIVVDDGSRDDTEAQVNWLQGHVAYSLKYIKQVQSGPASARNAGARAVRSEFILFTGDDIFPEKDLIEQHMRFLSLHPLAAILGFVGWSSESEVTDFMSYVAPNGFQFRYSTIKDPNNCDFRHFYTSNISLARKWLLENEFDENFPYGAMEDTELSYRLVKKGLKIIYNKDAKGYHFHPMTVDSFCEKMRCAGVSSAILLKKHPELRSILLPVSPALAFPLFFILSNFTLLKIINRRFYWFCRIAFSYLGGFKKAHNFSVDKL